MALKPTFGLTIRSGNAYLKLLIESQDSEIVRFREGMLSQTTTSFPKPWIEHYVGQIYVHILFDFLKDASLDAKSGEVKNWIRHLQALLPIQPPHILHSKNWSNKRGEFLALFQNLNNTRKSQVPDIIRGKDLVLKQALLYAEYLCFAAPDPNDEFQNLYQGALTALDQAKVPAPKLVGQSVMRSIHPQLCK